MQRYITILIATVLLLCDGEQSYGSSLKNHREQEHYRDEDYPFMNVSLPWDVRVDDLVGRLTLEEIIDQMSHGSWREGGPAPAIPRLNIGPYQFGTECLSGDVQAGNATSFPMSIGMAATFDPGLIFQVARATGVEVRAKHNSYVKEKEYGMHTGLSCWSPVINIMRHPLWGRNQETYGEDPYLTSILGQHFVYGLQADHPRYVLANAGCKHFDAYGGPENIPQSRFSFNAQVSDRDWYMTFLPQFKACVEAGTYSIMCSYNSVNGVPACASKELLIDILRTKWKFKGYVISDEGALEFILSFHKYTKNEVETAAAAVNAGCNLELGLPSLKKNIYSYLGEAVTKKLVNESTLRDLVKPSFYTRMRLGEFDPAGMNPYTSLNLSVVQSIEHRRLSLEATVKSYVMLKNDKNLLPLKDLSMNITLLGPFANNISGLFGDYSPNNTKSYVSTPYSELSLIMGEKLTYLPGCSDPKCSTYFPGPVIDAAKMSDLVIVCLGTGITIEAEGRDRSDLSLPGHQLQLLQDAVSVGRPTILVLYNAGPVDISWAKAKVPVIMLNFLPGQNAGKALVAVLLGYENPAGRLPYTWPASMSQVPDMTNYSMDGRTYRYFKGDPLYPFGYGLSYTNFSYSNIVVPKEIKPCDQAVVTAELRNIGNRNGDEVTQLYINWPKATVPVPQMQLVGVKRTFLEASQSIELSFTIEAAQFAVYTDQMVIEPGPINVYLGGQQYGQKTSAPSNVLHAVITIDGTEPVPISQCLGDVTA
ncbi:probable beta-D-xylosidase 6 [Dendronephthya gigantea]|uniref:probable beta-D-xylosidase 6 n=1 Tax=Dendronephthya gigantea TaxID=151771 RepID=UPI00106B44D7|nr:probable beta-D-xylosidase 6 [Dendronephthya gigantea]